MRARRLIAISAAVALAMMPAVSFAQSLDPAAATELFKQGREAMTHGEYKTACPKFAESLRLDAKVGTLLNLAECEDKIGLIASARQHLQRAVAQARAENDERLKLAEDKLAAIDKRVPRLVLTLAATAPPDTRVTRDGVELGAASLGTPLPVEPGAHTIVASAPGFEAKSYPITLNEGESRSLALEPGSKLVDVAPSPVAQPATASPAARVDTADDARSGSASTMRTWGFVTVGVGAVAAGFGTVFGLIAISKNSESKQTCDQNNVCDAPGKSLRDDARTDGTVSTVAFIVGGALLATGIALVFIAPKESTPARATARIEAAPAIGAGAGGFVVRARW